MFLINSSQKINQIIKNTTLSENQPMKFECNPYNGS